MSGTQTSASLFIPSAQHLSFPSFLGTLWRELNCTSSEKAKRRPGASSLTWMQVAVVILAAFIGCLCVMQCAECLDSDLSNDSVE